LHGPTYRRSWSRRLVEKVAAACDRDGGEPWQGHRDAELFSDLLVGEPVYVFQHHQDAQLRGEFVECDRKPVEQRGRLLRTFGLGLGPELDRLFDHRVERFGAMTSAAFHDGVRRVRGDPVHPRTELRVAAEARQALPGT
jgi:hypothetical protein